MTRRATNNPHGVVYGRLPEWNNQLDQKRPEIRLRIPQVLLIDPGQRSHATQQGKFAALFYEVRVQHKCFKTIIFQILY